MSKYFKFMLWFGLFLTLAIYGKARAESWSAPNQAGGKIVITDRKCNYFTYLSESYTYTAQGDVFKSCWAVIDGAIHIVYFDGSKKVYPISNFHPESSL